MNADDVFTAMLADIESARRVRESQEPSSPMRAFTLEAAFVRMYVMKYPSHNVTRARSVNLRWAVANLLHFFAATEEADALHRYNRYASRYLENGRFVGAYGPIAVPQLRDCCDLLKAYPASRRAIVSMGGFERKPSINKPSCWSFLHLLMQDDFLHMAVYQRSLNVIGVMPYDCILLTNVLLACAARIGVRPGFLHWVVGSCHAPAGSVYAPHPNGLTCNVVIPHDVLWNSATCERMLKSPEDWIGRGIADPYVDWLASDEEVQS